MSVTVTLYHHGTTAGVPPLKNSHERQKRGICEGWSASSTRSNTKFLYSVDQTKLTGLGFGVSLTLKEIPLNHEIFHKLRRALIRRLEREGMIRSHWLIEWQRRGAPHLHLAVWFDPDLLPPHMLKYRNDPDFEHLAKSYLTSFIKRSWLELTAEKFGSQECSQHVSPIFDSVGWLQYLSKHGSRGLNHYQRNSASIPQGWIKTGRMWGKTGEWPIGEILKIGMNINAFWVYRRIIRNYRKSIHRAKNDWRKLKSARGMLRCHDYGKSPVRGVSEWLELPLSLTIMKWLSDQGYPVES